VQPITKTDMPKLEDFWRSQPVAYNENR